MNHNLLACILECCLLDVWAMTHVIRTRPLLHIRSYITSYLQFIIYEWRRSAHALNFWPWQSMCIPRKKLYNADYESSLQPTGYSWGLHRRGLFSSSFPRFIEIHAAKQLCSFVHIMRIWFISDDLNHEIFDILAVVNCCFRVCSRIDISALKKGAMLI